ncbi:MAG: hypothetical protein JRE10_11875, partial [Deltaproteobacteria bacterium]|nr:hypothetical protein [Deltaproteobacteria bacterium]MBW2681239.1 hypothetical protein [Deltaproteobacteria bacterium]
ENRATAIRRGDNFNRPNTICRPVPVLQRGIAPDALYEKLIKRDKSGFGNTNQKIAGAEVKENQDDYGKDT